MTVKKMYIEIVELLEANQNKLVSEVLQDVINLASAKSNKGASGSTFIKDVNGDVVAIQCYYFKRFMPLVGNEAVEFGAKKSTTTGYNTMCKLGVSLWTKQNKQAKEETDAILERLEANEIDISQIAKIKAEIAERKARIEDTDLGFSTKEECLGYLDAQGIIVA